MEPSHLPEDFWILKRYSNRDNKPLIFCKIFNAWEAAFSYVKENYHATDESDYSLIDSISIWKIERIL